MEKFIYKLDQNDKTILSDLIIKEYCPIQDNNKNKLLINKLLLNNSKLFFETNYLKVVKIVDNKLFLEIPESHVDLFNYLDQKCSVLLENLINSENELVTWDIKWDSQNIEYKSIINHNSNILKISITSDTNIKMNNNKICISDIKIGDIIGIVLGLDYISLLIESMIARTKLFCYYIEIHRTNQYYSEPREIINDWEFSSKIKSENIFIKQELNELDNVDVKTDILLNHNLSDIHLNNNINLDDIESNNTTLLNNSINSCININNDEIYNQLDKSNSESTNSNIEISKLNELIEIDNKLENKLDNNKLDNDQSESNIELENILDKGLEEIDNKLDDKINNENNKLIIDQSDLNNEHSKIKVINKKVNNKKVNEKKVNNKLVKKTTQKNDKVKKTPEKIKK